MKIDLQQSPGSVSTSQLIAMQAKQFAKRRVNLLVLVIFMLAGLYSLYQGYADKRAKICTIQAFQHQNDSLVQDMRSGVMSDTATKEGKAKYRKSSALNSALFNTRLPSCKLPVSTALYNIGQSDVFTYYYLFGSENFEMQLLKQTEINNPLRALAGHFDVSFWLVYLLPLMILLFSFNTLSSERDSGNWRIIAAQGITERQWLVSKFAMVGLLAVGLLILVGLTGSVVNMIAFHQGSGWSDTLFFLSGMTYLVFWLSQFYFINSLRKTTAYNALVCGITWICFCLMIPVLVSRLADTAIPVDNTKISTFSRRPQNPEIERSKAYAAGIIRQFASIDHRYQNADADSTKPTLLVRTYQALHYIIHGQRWAVIEQYFRQVEKRQAFTNWSVVLNPASSTDGYLTALADNDAASYHHFTEQTEVLHSALQEAFYPAVFSDRLLNRSDYDGLPVFRYQRSPIPVSLVAYLLLLIAMVSLLIIQANRKLKRLF